MIRRPPEEPRLAGVLAISLAAHLAIGWGALALTRDREPAAVVTSVLNVRLMPLPGGGPPGPAVTPPKRVVEEPTPPEPAPPVEEKPEEPEEVPPPPEPAPVPVKKPAPAPLKTEKGAASSPEPSAALEPPARRAGPPAAPAPQAGSGGPGAFSGGSPGVSLDSPFPYPWYLDVLRRRVSAAWVKPSAADALDRGTIVYFRVLADGGLGLVEVERSSGLDMYDRSTLRAVHSMGRLPPLPTGFREAYLGVHFEFIP